MSSLHSASSCVPAASQKDAAAPSSCIARKRSGLTSRHCIGLQPAIASRPPRLRKSSRAGGRCQRRGQGTTSVGACASEFSGIVASIRSQSEHSHPARRVASGWSSRNPLPRSSLADHPPLILRLARLLQEIPASNQLSPSGHSRGLPAPLFQPCLPPLLPPPRRSIPPSTPSQPTCSQHVTPLS